MGALHKYAADHNEMRVISLSYPAYLSNDDPDGAWVRVTGRFSQVRAQTDRVIVTPQ